MCELNEGILLRSLWASRLEDNNEWESKYLHSTSSQSYSMPNKSVDNIPITDGTIWGTYQVEQEQLSQPQLAGPILNNACLQKQGLFLAMKAIRSAIWLEVE